MNKKSNIIIAVLTAVAILVGIFILGLLLSPHFRFHRAVTKAETLIDEGRYNEAASQLDKAIDADDTRSDVWMKRVDVQNQTDDYFGSAEILGRFLSRPPEYYGNPDVDSVQDIVYDVTAHAEKSNIDISSIEEILVGSNWDDIGISAVRTSKEFYILNTVGDEIIYEHQPDENSLQDDIREDYFRILCIGDKKYTCRRNSVYSENISGGDKTEIINDANQFRSMLWYDDVLYYICDNEGYSYNVFCYDTLNGDTWNLPVHADDIRYIVNDYMYIQDGETTYRVAIDDVRGKIQSDAFREHPTEIFYPFEFGGDLIIGNWVYDFSVSSCIATNSVTGEVRSFEHLGSYGLRMYKGNFYYSYMDRLYEVDGLLAKQINEVNVGDIQKNTVRPGYDTDFVIGYIDDNYVYVETRSFNMSPYIPNTIYRANKKDWQFVNIHENTVFSPG